MFASNTPGCRVIYFFLKYVDMIYDHKTFYYEFVLLLQEKVNQNNLERWKILVNQYEPHNRKFYNYINVRSDQ